MTDEPLEAILDRTEFRVEDDRVSLVMEEDDAQELLRRVREAGGGDSDRDVFDYLWGKRSSGPKPKSRRRPPSPAMAKLAEAGWTREALAERLGMSPPNLTNYLRGAVPANREDWFHGRLAEELGADLARAILSLIPATGRE